MKCLFSCDDDEMPASGPNLSVLSCYRTGAARPQRDSVRFARNRILNRPREMGRRVQRRLRGTSLRSGTPQRLRGLAAGIEFFEDRLDDVIDLGVGQRCVNRKAQFTQELVARHREVFR